MFKVLNIILFLMAIGAFPVVLSAFECGDVKIEYSKNNLSYYNMSNEKIKQVTLDANIEHAECLYNNLVVFSTTEYLYVASAKGTLITKLNIPEGYHYYYSADKNLYFKSSYQYGKYSIENNGKITHKKILAAADENVVLLSSNNIVFQETYYSIKNKNVPIILLYKDNHEIVYFNTEKNDVFKANIKSYNIHTSDLWITKILQKDRFYKKFKLLPENTKQLIAEKFKNDSIKYDLLKLYIANTNPNKISKKFIQKTVADASDSYKFYKLLRDESFVKLPYLGNFQYKSLSTLSKKIAELLNGTNNIFFRQYGRLSYSIDYPNSIKTEPKLIYKVDDKKLFKLTLPTKCVNYKTYQKEGTRSKGILIFSTVVYKSMFEYKNYKCEISQDVINKIKYTISQLSDSFEHSKPLTIKNNWKFTKRKLLYDISAKQTAIGKALSGGSSSSKCNEAYNSCKNNCKIKNGNNGFFIFSSSDKNKCENYCYYAFDDCKNGKTSSMNRNICIAKCVGYSEEGGFFSKSKHEKCMDRCLESLRGE